MNTSNLKPNMTCCEVTQSKEEPKLVQRAAIYSRVSTEQEIQESSFEIQKEYFLNKIKNGPLTRFRSN